MDKKIKDTKFYRSNEIQKKDVNEKTRQVAISFSSEEPYERFFGMEILDHSTAAVQLQRLNKGGAVLLNHDVNEQVGVIEKAFVADRKGSAVIRFGKSKRADEIFQDVRDGIRQNISVGYQIHKMEPEDSDAENPVFRATRWEPLEVSIVSVPADITVGVNRDDNDNNFKRNEVIKMEDKKIKNQLKDEKHRVRELLALGETFEMAEAAKEAVNKGTEVEAFKTEILEKVANVKPIETDPDLGLSKREIKDYSIIRVLSSQLSGQTLSGIELEAHQALLKKSDQKARGILVPFEVMGTPQRRDLTTTSDTAGGYLVGTKLTSFIQILRNRSFVVALGAEVMSGLVSNIAIPKLAGSATAEWIAEGSNVTTTDQTTAQIQMTPRTLAAGTIISRKVLLQSEPSAENVVKDDISSIVATEIDRAAINGSGTNNQPTGILQTSGIGSVVGGTNGLAPTWAHMVDLESEVSNDNADVGRLGYLSNSKVRGKLKQVFTNATYGETPIWQGDTEPGVGKVNGYRAYASNNVPSNLTKGSSSGVCSAIIFGNWADLIIGQWSGLDILVDPYSYSTYGSLQILIYTDIDIAVKHAESFAAMVDALTA